MRHASLPLFTYEEMEEQQVVKFGYTDFMVNNDKWSAKCEICQAATAPAWFQQFVDEEQKRTDECLSLDLWPWPWSWP